ncbi:Oidioi.mRNA.OKI2018_I69.chr2.g4314.t1.cds [Oikopleura dioica]|uniref:Oidioi.mRNA.OKI2018_I69.chr2.g4314.t1.cds n=1 Tax=Oikopleura dioica TaxID=34765 RepID=A0ABN7SYJ7_OIKDI|nr:Oidioi.mRNA.OKI2018_I69.chr2.g4314.t1.cds [Oikopleura dioica]
MNNLSIEYSAFEKMITKNKRRSSSPIPSRIRLSSPQPRFNAPLAVRVHSVAPQKRSAVQKILKTIRKKILIKRKESAASIEFSYAQRSLNGSELRERIEQTRNERLELQRKLASMESKAKSRVQAPRRTESIKEAMKQKVLIQKRLKRRSQEATQNYHVSATIKLNA